MRWLGRGEVAVLLVRCIYMGVCNSGVSERVYHLNMLAECVPLLSSAFLPCSDTFLGLWETGPQGGNQEARAKVSACKHIPHPAQWDGRQ